MPAVAHSAEIRSFLRAELSVILGAELPELSDDMRLFDELGLDSAGVIELLIRMEDSFGLPVDPDDLTRAVFQTVGTLSAYIAAGLAGVRGEAG
ncbi:acyl carrier protein [Nonomuraea sp. NPDC052265]|uniref:acyl carrier protein n=1 Tax=Nonomuraea sp. NPDC052265 TaxID=3364374 RepID=UPI0037CC9236